MPLPIPQPQAKMKWRHCTIDPPIAGSNYLILELLDNGAWRHTVDHYGFEEEYTFEVWMSGHDRALSWWVEIPEPYPDMESIRWVNEVKAEA